ncbi:type VI secretion system Vgr family protein [Hyalangium rubrum]|uniref:Type VI secretion system tip protein TssI/VgrG n=1 Tax=Hyalangium rubrum TaxID=3103134 RepID=A0ABU5HCP6_9BACT|nr:type VI secretion system tip protein TssI/VgrG [Hyalangium sp. s54d21]MDY7230917.1 type VI secretion system tip protein TssI/VgrG [Hyalangium sp. s54d21]
MARTKAPAFTLKVGPHAAPSLVVAQFSGSESLSRLYDFQVEFFEKDGQLLELSELPGTEALLTIQIGEAPVRYVHGRVRRAESLGQLGGRWLYRVQVAPKLERLRQMRKSRIFQEKAVPDIVKAVLGEAGVEHRLALSGSYATREYCVQYRESDFDFISRLLESEGIFYFFEHAEGSHTLVLGDGPNAHADLPGGAKLPLREDDARVYDVEFVSRMERVHRLRPGAVMLRDFDFVKPALDLSTTSTSAEGLSELELYDYPGEYVAPGVGKSVSKVRMEEKAQGAQTYTGRSLCPRLAPGYLIEVEKPGDGTFCGQYLVEEVEHSGQQPDTLGNAETLGALYRNTFRSLPKDVPFRPLRVTPRPHVPGVQTATVVGPGGEEIHTDEHGRIKVQFHWDREGKQDDKSSCWVRVGQSWGGLAWGALYLPRIGQEVLIRFLEGNADRPLVAGSVYNGENPTPYGLPADRTKSTLKSASSLGSAGFNEFRIEDKKAEEEIFVHAQKDEDLVTENDKDQEVVGYEDLLVKKDRKLTVEGNQQLAVTLDDASLVEGNQSLKVQGNRTTTTRGSHSEEVEGNQSITVSKNVTTTITLAAAETVGAAKALTIGAGYAVTVALASTESVGGLKASEIGAARLEYVVGSRQELITKDSTVKVGSDFQTEVKGQMNSTVGKDREEKVNASSELGVKEPAAFLAKKFDLKADKFLLIVNGNLILSIEKNNVKLCANKLTVDGSDVKVKGGKVKMLGAGSLTSKSVKLKNIQAIPAMNFKPMDFEGKAGDAKAMADAAQELHGSASALKNI